MQHTVRTKSGGTTEIANYYRSKAIKTFCTECMGWDEHPNNCTAPLCPLYPYRGKTLRTVK